MNNQKPLMCDQKLPRHAKDLAKERHALLDTIIAWSTIHGVSSAEVIMLLADLSASFTTTWFELFVDNIKAGTASEGESDAKAKNTTDYKM